MPGPLLAVIIIGGIILAPFIVLAVGTAIYDIRKASELSKTKAVGMPPPPPGMRKKHMKNAAKKLKLDYEYYNFGFCGSQGSGKSSLINGMRNVPDVTKTSDWQHDPSAAAPVGETETTTELNWYESPKGDNAMTYVRLWDVPGCGTINCPMQNYFNERFLYVFDCLIVVSRGILGEYELNMINAAGECGRPVIVVLSQSELKAESKAKRIHGKKDLSVEDYQPIVQDTINEAKESMQITIEQAKSKYKSLNVSKIFVVSAAKYRDWLTNPNGIDELLSFETSNLLVHLLETAIDKRVP